jgi:hypothetical protein
MRSDILQLEKEVWWGLGTTELRKLRQLEDENFRLKQIIADLTLANRCFRMYCEKCSEANPVEGIGLEHTG